MQYNSLVKCTVRNDVDTIHIKANVITDSIDTNEIERKARFIIMEAENCPRCAIINTEIVSTHNIN